MPAQTVIKFRRDTTANWTSANPVLAAGEAGFETTTNKLKIGNGSTAWNSLAYASGAGGVTVSETAPSSPESGMMWFSSSEAKTYIYYDGYWVELSPAIAGPAATIAVGTTTTGAAGSSATVTNSGTSSAAIFDFTVPVGATGPTGPSGTISVTAPIVNSGTSTAAALSLDSTAVITTSAQTLSNKTLSSPLFSGAARENIYLTGTGFAGFTFYATTNGAVQFSSASATANGTLNITSASGQTLDSIMSTGQSITVTYLINNGGTAYYPTAIQVDGAAPAAIKYPFGTAFSSGNTNSWDVYTFTIIKNASASFWVLASQSKFA